MAGYLGVKSSHIAYLENGRRSPSGDLILRYRKIEQRLRSKLGRKMAS
jgi:transcriptional regulator with XRE-family HTH domain